MQRLIALLVVGLIVTSSLADGLLQDGMSARVAGRGGTNLGFADSGTILHDNPGGMVNFGGRSLAHVGVDVLLADIQYAKSVGPADSDEDPVPLGQIALLHHINPELAIGLGLFTPGGLATDYRMPGPAPFFGQQKYKSFGSLGRILPGISWRANDRLSLGATAGVAISHVELEGPYTLQSGALRGVPTLLDVQGTGAAFTWSLGLQYQLSCQTTLGASFQAENRFHLDGSTRAFVPLPGTGASAFDSQIDMTWPRSVGLGLRHAFCDHQVGSLDIIYYNWAAAFDDVGLLLTNPTNPAFAAFGPEIQEQLPLRWRDTVSVRLGFERTLRNLDLIRWGYAYHRNPITEAYQTPFIVSTVEHTLAVGYGTQVHGWEVDLGYQFMFAPTKFVGTSSIAGGEYDNSQLRTNAHFVYVSFIRRS
jgi:long-subunit fatty acid transport protein